MRVIRCEGSGDGSYVWCVPCVKENEGVGLVNGFVIKNVWSSGEVS